MNRLSLLFFVVTTFALGTSEGAIAQSFYSSRGIGLISYFVSGQASGMGGVGLASSDAFTVNYLNPSTLVSLPVTFISGNFLHASTSLSGSDQDATFTDTNVSGFHFVVPLKRNRIALAVGLTPYSKIEYAFEGSSGIDEKSFDEIVTGDGGINTAMLSLAVAPSSRVSFGITGLLHFGVLRNRWTVLFDDANVLNARDEIARDVKAFGMRVGVRVAVLKDWYVGAVFAPKVAIDADLSLNLQSINSRREDLMTTEFDIPLSFGFGTSVRLAKKVTVGVDYYREGWSDSGVPAMRNDSQRLGAGLQFQASSNLRDSYFERVAYRAGFYYRDLGLEDPVGESVTELFGTVGVGLPIRWAASRIDLSFEAGRRGSTSSNPFRETVLKFNATVSVGERWFFRGGSR